MYNKVIMIGRLVADPEMRTTPGGDQVAGYRIAVDRSGGKGKDRKTDFFSVNAWFFRCFCVNLHILQVNGHVMSWRSFAFGITALQPVFV